MRLVFAGTPDIAVPSLRALAHSGHEVGGVLTRDDAPVGRKRVLTPSPVALAAEELQLPVLKCNRPDERVAGELAELRPELGVIVAYGGLLREPLLSLPTLGWINLHFSDLPRWRGAAPVQRALMAGETTIGLTVFRLVAALDAGPVLTRGAHEFASGTTAGQALAALAETGVGLVTAAIEVLRHQPTAGEPQRGAATHAAKLRREDGRLSVTGTAPEVLAQWAGTTPEPGAYAMEGEDPVKLLQLQALPARDVAGGVAPRGIRGAEERARAGTVRLLDGRAILSVLDGDLELVRVQPAGRPAMDAAAWLRGRGGAVVLR